MCRLKGVILSCTSRNVLLFKLTVNDLFIEINDRMIEWIGKNYFLKCEISSKWRLNVASCICCVVKYFGPDNIRTVNHNNCLHVLCLTNKSHSFWCSVGQVLIINSYQDGEIPIRKRITRSLWSLIDVWSMFLLFICCLFGEIHAACAWFCLWYTW